MLLHIIPRLRALRVGEPECRLVDVRCDALGLHLREGVELTARRPHPNKDYLVACRKVGQRAISGILVETDRRLDHFSVVTRWAVGAERLVTHHVRYFVLDDDFDALTDDMTLWYGHANTEWMSRWPAWAVGVAPLHAQPLMEVASHTKRAGTCADRVDRGRIVERSEVFQLPTIERERIVADAAPRNWRFGRLPVIEHAFKVGTP